MYQAIVLALRPSLLFIVLFLTGLGFISYQSIIFLFPGSLVHAVLQFISLPLPFFTVHLPLRAAFARLSVSLRAFAARLAVSSRAAFARRSESLDEPLALFLTSSCRFAFALPLLPNAMTDSFHRFFLDSSLRFSIALIRAIFLLYAATLWSTASCCAALRSPSARSAFILCATASSAFE
jgi:hypothetical protein